MNALATMAMVLLGTDADTAQTFASIGQTIYRKELI